MALEVGVNSYVTVQEATDYLLARYPNCVEVEEGMIILGAQVIDGMIFHGCKSEANQVMEFPRDYETEVSQRVKDAQCEEIYAQSKALGSERHHLQLEGVTSISVSKASESYDAFRVRAVQSGKLLSPVAKRLLRPYLLGVAEIV